MLMVAKKTAARPRYRAISPAPVFAWRSEPGRALYAPGGGAFASAAGLYSYFATADAIFVHAV